MEMYLAGAARARQDATCLWGSSAYLGLIFPLEVTELCLLRAGPLAPQVDDVQCFLA